MRSTRGFTLIETLVALLVLAGTLIAFQRLLGGGWSGTRRAIAETEAVEIARNRLALAGIETPLRAGETSGTDGATTDWRIIVAPLASASPMPQRLQKTGYWVTAEVRFQDDRTQAPRLVRLTTLKLGARQ